MRDKNMDKNLDKLFTIEEVAELLRVSTRTVTRYIETGKLKASKIGAWRIKETDLKEFLEQTSNINKFNKK
ncbi:MAG: helix-turn-helix domain-containing protein [Candidatus Paceibacterota bacterium]|jgi:excisionase family DNA binding protein